MIDPNFAEWLRRTGYADWIPDLKETQRNIERAAQDRVATLPDISREFPDAAARYAEWLAQLQTEAIWLLYMSGSGSKLARFRNARYLASKPELFQAVQEHLRILTDPNDRENAASMLALARRLWRELRYGKSRKRKQ